jgi:uncharacterized membrane protein
MPTGPQRMYMGKPHSIFATPRRPVNVGDTERAVSAVAGGVLAVWGLSRMSLGGLLLAGVGAALGYRAMTGHCDAYAAMGVNTARPRTVGNLGVKIDESIIVNAPPARVYAIWRNFENLPRVFSHVERVEVLDRTRSRWTIKMPGAPSVTWDAEIINDKPNELIAWRTAGSTLVEHAGSVRFELAGDGTKVSVSLQYDPPGGRFGDALASLVSQDAGSQIARDLANFKRAVEEGRLAA